MDWTERSNPDTAPLTRILGLRHENPNTMSQPGEVKKKCPVMEEELKGARSKLGLKGERKSKTYEVMIECGGRSKHYYLCSWPCLSILRAYGECGSLCVQWGEVLTRDCTGKA